MPERRLYLMRHAKSSWDDPALPDRERPLARRGRKATARVSRHLSERGVVPDLVLCSPSARTRETLAGLGAPFDDPERVRIEEAAYAASAATLLALVRDLPGGSRSAMVIAHNPGLQDLTLLLASGGEGLGRVEEGFPTAAVATLEFDVPWSELAPGACRLADLVYPRELG